MICQRCAKDVPAIHTCTPSDLVRGLEEIAKARTLQTAEVTAKMRVLEAELLELRKDAERYRWLRSRDVGPAQIWELVNDDCNPPCTTLKIEAELDAAIDAALAKEQP